MKWPKPRRYIQDEIKNPMQVIGVIAATALLVAVMALFVAMGKDG